MLELGSAQGVTTELISRIAKEVIGLDKSEFHTEHSIHRNTHNMTFLNGDAFNLTFVRSLGRQFTAIFIDVSGSRPIGDVLKLIESYQVRLKAELDDGGFI